MSKRADRIIERHSELNADASNWRDHWREVLRLVLPRKDDVYTFGQIKSIQGEKKQNHLLDTTAQNLNEELAAELGSKLTNPYVQWMELTHPVKKINALTDVRKFLQELTSSWFTVLQNTNFYTEISEFYEDLLAAGTAIMIMEEDKKDLIRFECFPIYECNIGENSRGVVDTVSREKLMTVRQVLQKFGKSGHKLFDTNPALKGMKEKLEEPMIMIHMVMPKADLEIMGLGKIAMSHASVWLHKETRVIFQEGGFKEFPYIVGRWSKRSGENYGRGPGIKSLPANKMLQSMMLSTIRAVQKSIDPPTLVNDDSIVGRLNINPGGVTPVRGKANEAAFPLLTGANPALGEQSMESVRKQLRDAYFRDKQRIREGDRMTTVEVDQRINENHSGFGPILARLNDDVLAPLVNRGLGIMSRKGKVPENVPPQLENTALNAFFTSQIAKAQRLGEVKAINAFMGLVGPLLQIKPEAADLIDGDNTLKIIGEITGVNAGIFSDDDKVEGTRKKREEAAKQQEQQAQEMQAAEIANKTAPAVQAAGQATAKG